MNSFFHSLKFKIAFLTTGITMVVYAAVFVYMVFSFKKNSIIEGRKLAQTVAIQKAGEIEKNLLKDMSIANTLSKTIMASLNLSKGQRELLIEKTVFEILNSNERYRDVFISYEMQVLDPGWKKNEVENIVYHLTGNKLNKTINYYPILEESKDEFYYIIRKEKKDAFDGPYTELNKNGNETKLISPSSPIFLDGAFAGRFGSTVELGENFLSISDIKLFDNSNATLINEEGIIVSSQNEQLINTPISKLSYMGSIKFDSLQNLPTGSVIDYIVTDQFNNEILISLTPIEVTESAKWILAVKIPVGEIVLPVNKIFKASSLTAFSGLILIVFISFKISTSTSEHIRKTISTLKDLSKGKLDGSYEFSENSKGELGLLKESIKNLIIEMRTKANFSREVGEGNLGVDLAVTGDYDVLGNSLISMRHNLESVISETKFVIEKAINGEMKSIRMSSRRKNGAWKELSYLLNELLDSISTPFLQFDKVVNAVANGDLTVSMNEENSKGDVKKLSENLNKSIKQLSWLLAEISTTTLELDDSVSEINSLSGEMKVSTSEIASATAQMSNGAQKQLASVSETSKNIDEIIKSIQKVEVEAEKINQSASDGVISCDEGMTLMNNVDENIKKSVSYSKHTQESFKVVKDHTIEISKILNVIGEIASETNLLSLNAAIEAANAGAAGRGFALIAEKIRELAQNSKTSAKKIEKLILDVNSDVTIADKVIKDMVQSVISVEKASHEALEKFYLITNLSKETLTASEQIGKSIVSQSNQVDKITTLSESVVVIAEQTATGTEEVAASAAQLSAGMNGYVRSSQQLENMANRLREQMNNFQLLT